MTHSPAASSRTARVLMPATSEPASGSVMPRQRIFSPAIAGTTHSCFCSSVPNGEDRRHRHVGVDRDAHRQAARLRVHDLLGEHERREVVAALPAVLLGLVEAEEPELAHALEDPVRERRLLPLLGVRRELLLANARIDSRSCSCSSVKMKCLRLVGEVGLEDGGGHGPRVSSGTSYLQLGTPPRRRFVPHVR